MSENRRREPKQARSQQRVEHILATAAQIFQEVGYEAATTNLIAARADVPIGSLYQFFPNKKALTDALIEQYMGELQTVFAVDITQPLAALLDSLIDALISFNASHEAFEALFIDVDIAQQIHALIIHGTETILAHHFPALDPALRVQTAIAGVSIVKGMMKLSASPDNLTQDVAASEVKLALLGYVRAVLRRAGLPLPEALQKL